MFFFWIYLSTGETHFLEDGSRVVSDPPSFGHVFWWGILWGNQARTVFDLCLNYREVEKASDKSNDRK
jgi:hypothetical protein